LIKALSEEELRGLAQIWKERKHPKFSHAAEELIALLIENNKD
jgi:hypothetical protein